MYKICLKRKSPIFYNRSIDFIQLVLLWHWTAFKSIHADSNQKDLTARQTTNNLSPPFLQTNPFNVI